MRKHVILLACLATLLSTASGQGDFGNRPYVVGDTLPDLPLGSYLMNFENPQATLHDFHGKYVILDFWETFCQPCINALPKLQTLQDQYSDELQIITVTLDTEKNVRALLARSQVTKEENIRLPFAIGDTLLREAFPHRVIPHVIIVNPQGIVQGITHGDEITEANIKAMLAGNKTDWIVKNDGGDAVISGNDPISEPDSMLVWSASLKKGGGGLARISRHETANSISNIEIETFPFDIYYKMFSFFSVGVMGNANVQRIHLDIRDSLTRRRYANKDLPVPFFPSNFPYLQYANRMEYVSDNVFSYHASFPPATSDSLILDYVFRDLNKAWPIKGEIVQEIRHSYVIKANEKAANLLHSKGGDPVAPFDHITIHIQNQPISEFFKVLAWFVDGPPIFDETGISDPIDINIDFSESKLLNPKRGLIVNNPLDMGILEKELARYGLYLVQEEREVSMLRIYDEVSGSENTENRPLK